jgi:O-antigen ligase
LRAVVAGAAGGLRGGGLAAGGVALLAKSELFGGPLMRLEFGRPMGPFSSPGPFGNYSAVIAMACLAGWLGGAGLRGGRWVRLAALLGVSGGLVASLLSETRSAWASLPVMALVAATVLGGPAGWPARSGRRGGGGPAGGGAAGGGHRARAAAAGGERSPGLSGRSHRCSGPRDVDGAAPAQLGVGLAAVSGPPAAGHRRGQLPRHRRRGRGGRGLPEVLRNFNGLHNLLVDHLTTTGLVGTLAMLGFWVGMFRHFGPRGGAEGPRRLFAGWGLMVLAAELVFASVGSMFASSLGTVAFTVLLAVCAAGAHPATPERG